MNMMCLLRDKTKAVLLLTAMLLFSQVATAGELPWGYGEEVERAAKLCNQKSFISAAQFYLGISHSKAHQLSSAERLDLIRVLAQCDKPDIAITELEDFIQEQPTFVEAQLLLANQLSWNGRLLEAEAVAENILTLSPDHREARLIQANAANWRGDYFTALPIYRELLLEEEEFEVRLNYTYALLATGDYHEAKISRWWLYAASQLKKNSLFEVNQALFDQARQSVSWKTEYLAEQGGSQRLDHGLSFNFPFNLSGMSLKLRHQRATAPWVDTVEEVDELMLEGRWRQSSAWRVAGQLGWITGGSTQEVGNLNAEISSMLQMQRWLWDIKWSHELFDDSAAILANNIQRQDLYSDLQYMFSDWLRVNGSLQTTHYSDDNHSYEAVFHARYALSLLKPRVEIGYKYFQQGFQRQSGGGYYSPEQNYSQQLTLGFNRSNEKLVTYGEMFYGRQTTVMAGLDARDNVAGLALNLNYNIRNRLSVNAGVEAGHYALSRPNGYYYYMVTSGLSFFF